MQPLTFVSDLHIDYNKSANLFVNAYKNYSGYLIIAGDFAEVREKDSIFFRTFEALFEINPDIYIIFVCGNHEYYGGSIQGVHDLINEWVEEKDMDRFFFLHEELEQLHINDTMFVGSTLWYPDSNPDVYLLQNHINDFSEIQGFTPSVAAEQNDKIKNCILQRSNCKNEIWVFHHLPSYQSVSSQYRNDRLNCYYVDPEMEKIIEQRQPNLVIHGHSHTSSRYQIGDTWVVSNPKGYGYQNAQSFDYFKHLIWVNKMSNVFSVGDFVRTRKEIKFADGGSHSFDSVHLITEDTLAYYNNPCNSNYYKKVEPLKNSQKQVYLSEITELASVFLDSSTEELSSITSTILDLGSSYQIPWPCAEVFSYKGENFLVKEYESDGEDNYSERTKVVNDKVWREVIELILEQVRKETLNKLLSYI